MRRALLLLLCGCNILGWHNEAAEQHAQDWADKVGVELLDCGGSDNDGDGYVSCTFRVNDSIETFECAGWTWLTPHDGCRAPKIKVPAPASRGGSRE